MKFVTGFMQHIKPLYQWVDFDLAQNMNSALVACKP